MLRLQHAGLKKHWQKPPQPPVHTTPQAKEGEAKRQAVSGSYSLAKVT